MHVFDMVVSGVFSPKSRAKTMTVDERKHVDGCAIFFRASKFSLVKGKSVNGVALASLIYDDHETGALLLGTWYGIEMIEFNHFNIFLWRFYA